MVLAWARKWTEQALQSSGTLDYTIASTAFELAARDGDAALYDRLVREAEAGKNAGRILRVPGRAQLVLRSRS